MTLIMRTCDEISQSYDLDDSRGTQNQWFLPRGSHDSATPPKNPLPVRDKPLLPRCGCIAGWHQCCLFDFPERYYFSWGNFAAHDLLN